ncbi:MAG: hypothetical protein R2867_32255 [Caldilineaceae bacterium]
MMTIPCAVVSAEDLKYSFVTGSKAALASKTGDIHYIHFTSPFRLDQHTARGATKQSVATNDTCFDFPPDGSATWRLIAAPSAANTVATIVAFAQ